MGFCSDWAYKCACKIWISYVRSWDNMEYPKKWAVPGYAHAYFSPKNFNGLLLRWTLWIFLAVEWYFQYFIVYVFFCVFTARCTLVQSAVLRSHVVCLSVCPSVRLSVTLVDQDHIGRKSWKQIARTLSLTPSLFVAQWPSTYSQGNMGKFWRD